MTEIKLKMVNEKCEHQSKCRKILKPHVATTFHIVFKPNTIGLQKSLFTVEFSNASKLCQLPLTGYGGCPKLRVEGTDSDVFGNKMVKLAQPLSGSFVYSAQFHITNYGNVRGFVQVKSMAMVLPVAHGLCIYPQEAIIEPNQNILITVSQHLSRDEVKDIMGQHDLRKLATLSVVMGDEPSRQRLRRFIENRRSSTREGVKSLIVPFPCEKPFGDRCIESKDFETIFLKSTKSMEIMVVLEKEEGASELEWEEEHKSFTSLCDTILVQPAGTRGASEKSINFAADKRFKVSDTPRASQSDPSRKIADWIQTLQ